MAVTVVTPSTQTIKERLNDYAATLREIDNQIERLERMETVMTSPKVQHIDGMPRSGSVAGDRIATMIGDKEELERSIRAQIQEEQQERATLDRMVAALRKPDERAVIRLRYFDRADWQEIAEILFADRTDYEERVDTYLSKTFKLHGAALARLTEAQEGSGVE